MSDNLGCDIETKYYFVKGFITLLSFIAGRLIGDINTYMPLLEACLKLAQIFCFTFGGLVSTIAVYKFIIEKMK